MTTSLYRIRFSDAIAPQDIEDTLFMAIVATESLHGESQARLDVAHFLDPTARACVVDAGTAAGRDLSRLLVGFLRREFGEDAFDIQRMMRTPAHESASVAA